MSAHATGIENLGRTEHFDEVRHFFQSADYSDGSICRRLHLERVEDFELDRKKRAPLPAPESASDILSTIFLAGETVKLETARQLLGAEKIALLEGMGLLLAEPGAGQCWAPVALYPVEGLYIASDRWSNPDGSQFSAPLDTVYPAFIPNTRLFLRNLPERPGSKFLDLCAGTGIAALLAAKRGANQAWSGDILGRASQFAEFNRRLNGILNVHVVTSDLYGSFEGCRFDLISAHPPYVPTLQPKWIFFSGGRDGEDITRRIIEGLPDHLDDGGIFISLTMGGDRIDQPFEHRIRQWLGTHGREFDIAFLARREFDPQAFALRANRETIRPREESELWSQLFKNMGVTSLSYGFIVVQRRSGAHRTFTLRRQSPPRAQRLPWEWLLRWETAASGERLTEIILDSPLHASHRTDFEVLHRLEQGVWHPSSYKLRTEHPFDMECDAQPWMAHLISLCDGRVTGREALQALVEHEVLPGATPEDEFARAAASLVSGGFIEVEGFRPPQATK
jgi:SAM-dependent methyltransferase